MLARWLGAKKIILLGYDCSIKNGFHWHGKHERPLQNCGSIKKWPKMFEIVSKLLADIEVLNVSRETSLTCFKKDTLENVINGDY